MKEKGKKRSHKGLKILLGFIVLLFVAIIVLAVWQRDNISALMRAQSQTQETIAEEISASKENTQKEIEKYNIPIKRDFTLEEEEAIRQGTLSVEEAVSRILGNDREEGTAQQSDNESGTTSAGNTSDPTSSHSTSVQQLTEEQQIVTDSLTELYSLKAYYIGQLGVVENDLKAQYKAEVGTKFNATAVAKIVQKNMSRIISLESECDDKVYSVLDTMRSELEAIGADTSIVDVAEDSYVNEKSLRKSYYLSMYK